MKLFILRNFINTAIIIILLPGIQSENSLAQTFPFLAQAQFDNVNIRSGQGTGFEKVAQLNKGDEVVVVEESYSWYKVKLPKSADSFIHSQFMRILSEHFAEVTANRVNIRAGAGTDHTVLGQVDKGAHVYLIAQVGEWYKIEPAEDSYGWVTKDFLAFKSQEIPVETKQAVVSIRDVPQTPVSSSLSLQPKENVPAAPQALPAVPESSVSDIVSTTDEGKNEDTRLVVVVGKLEQDQSGASRYKIHTRGTPAYYNLQGIDDRLLEEFLPYEVKVEGKIKTAAKKEETNILEVSQIQLLI